MSIEAGDCHAGPNLADYAGTDGFSAKLARFPGAKRFWLCA